MYPVMSSQSTIRMRNNEGMKQYRIIGQLFLGVDLRHKRFASKTPEKLGQGVDRLRVCIQSTE